MSEGTPFDERSSGVLLHPTSLPGPHGVGDLGPAAHGFIDFLHGASQRWWQMLPIGPPGGGNSPYDSPSAFAGSPLLISLEFLVRDRLLDRSEIAPPRALARAQRARYEAAARFRLPRLRRAFERFGGPGFSRLRQQFEAFRSDTSNWLADHTLFSALAAEQRSAAWPAWEPGLARRQKAALERARNKLAREIRFFEFLQFLFARHWAELRERAAESGILLLGDIPMFVAHHGSDVWSHQELFHLDRNGHKTVVAGVPPDPFSKDGQLWGNALYRWPLLEGGNFGWWVDRFKTALSRFDAVRIDHFIGLHRCWEVKAGAKTAKIGRFVRVPGEKLLTRLRSALGGLPVVAEDLGLVTPEVTGLRDQFGLPGMVVLQFGFGDSGGREHEPHRYVRRLLAYTGTHDNDTFMGWFRALARHGGRGPEARVRKRVNTYLGSPKSEVHWHAIRALVLSVANTVVFPLQDLMGLGSEARMNVPGVATGNWVWRFGEEQLTPAMAERMASLCDVSERAASHDPRTTRRSRSR